VSSVGCRTGGSHHIADVVHHFLSDGHGECSRGTPAAETGSAPVRFFAVAAAGRNPTAAVAAAGLATGIVPELRGDVRQRTAVFLRERPGQQWSAFNYLHGRDADGSQRVVDSTHGGSRQGGCAGLGGGLIVAGRVVAGRPLTEPLPVVNWWNLGPLDAARLADLEAARSWREEIGCPVAGRDGLVWCLLPHEVGSYRCAYALGRLAAACRPRRVVLLIFPDCRATAAVARAVPSAATTDLSAVDRSAAWLRRCSALAEAVLLRVPVTAVYLGCGSRDGCQVEESVATGLGRVAHSLLASSRS